jgi:hypothetical protein
MIEEHNGTKAPTAEELRDACQTLSGMPSPNAELSAQLQYVAELLGEAGPLPSCPLLVWRDSDQTVHHAIIGSPFLVGRIPGAAGLAFPEDKLLSRSHFSICITEEGSVLRNLSSKNGTAVNRNGEPVSERLLRNGDLIIAGSHVFAFLDQTET